MTTRPSGVVLKYVLPPLRMWKAPHAMADRPSSTSAVLQSTRRLMLGAVLAGAARHGVDVGLVVLPEVGRVGARHGALLAHPGDSHGGVETAGEGDADALTDRERREDLGHGCKYMHSDAYLSNRVCRVPSLPDRKSNPSAPGRCAQTRTRADGLLFRSIGGGGRSALAARVAGRAGGDVVELVLLGRPTRDVGVDLALAWRAAAASAPRPTGRRCGRSGAPPAGCRRSRSRRRRAWRRCPGTHSRIWSWTARM